MYVPIFNFHFTLESSVQKEAMQAKKLQWLRQTTYDNLKAPSNVQSSLQVHCGNGILKAGAGGDKISMLVINI